MKAIKEQEMEATSKKNYALGKNNTFKLIIDTYAIENDVAVIGASASCVTYKVNANKYLSYGKQLSKGEKYEIIRNTTFEPYADNIMHFFFKHISKGKEYIAVNILAGKIGEDDGEEWMLVDDGTIVNAETTKQLSIIQKSIYKLNDQIDEKETLFYKTLEQYKNFYGPIPSVDIESPEIPF